VIINRYFAKEILQALFAVMSVLLLIFMGRFFARYLSWVAEGFIPADIVINLLMLRTIAALNMILPFAFFLAVVIAFGRFYKDSEMTALAASGVSLDFVIRGVAMIAFFVAVVVTIFTFFIVPWAHDKAQRVQDRAKSAPLIDTVSAGVFNEVDSPPDSVFYAKNFSEDGRYMKDVFVKITKANGKVEIFSAREGLQITDPDTGDRYFELRFGYQYVGTIGEMDFTVQQYKKTAIRIVPQRITTNHAGIDSLPTSVLINSSNPKHLAELHWRIAMPISTVILSLLALLLSRTSPRQGRYGKLFVSILIFIVYNNGISMARTWIEQEKLSTTLGIWWLHLLFLTLGFILYQQQNNRLRFGFKRRLPQVA